MIGNPDNEEEIQRYLTLIAQEFQPRKGTYAALFALPRPTYFSAIGRAGRFLTVTSESGYFVYVGSAFGSGGVLAHIQNHARHATNILWHLDSVRAAMALAKIWFTFDSTKRECAWSNLLHNVLGGSVPVPGFGAAECDRCPAPFYHFVERPSFATFCKAAKQGIEQHAQIEKATMPQCQHDAAPTNTLA